MKEAKGKKVVVFLDYDGTLSPIVEDPDKAFMSTEVPFHYFTYVCMHVQQKVIFISAVQC